VIFILNDDDFDLYPQNARRSKPARGSRDSNPGSKAHQCELIHFLSRKILYEVAKLQSLTSQGPAKIIVLSGIRGFVN